MSIELRNETLKSFSKLEYMVVGFTIEWSDWTILWPMPDVSIFK